MYIMEYIDWMLITCSHIGYVECSLMLYFQHAALVSQEFLENTASQLTYHGLCELNQRVIEGEFCVFFRNNHFNTLLKREVVDILTSTYVICKYLSNDVYMYT